MAEVLSEVAPERRYEQGRQAETQGRKRSEKHSAAKRLPGREALPTPLPHHRPRTINDKKMASCLAAAAKFTDALKHDGAELRKSRLKLDEIVILFKTGAEPASIMNLIESAVQECRRDFAQGRKTLGDFEEVFATDDEASAPGR